MAEDTSERHLIFLLNTLSDALHTDNCGPAATTAPEQTAAAEVRMEVGVRLEKQKAERRDSAKLFMF